MSTENVKILLRRGFRDEITSATLEIGEMGFTTDTNQLFVGIDDAVNEIQFDPFVNAHAVIQSWLDDTDNPEPGLIVDEDLVIRHVVDVEALLTAMNNTAAFNVAEYGRPRKQVEVITENSFNQLFADQHLSSLDAVTGLRPSLFRKTFTDTNGTFLKYQRDVCTSFFIDYSLKQYDGNVTYIRVGQLKIVNGYKLGVAQAKLTDDNTEIWQDDSDGIAEVDEFSNIEFDTNFRTKQVLNSKAYVNDDANIISDTIIINGITMPTGVSLQEIKDTINNTVPDISAEVHEFDIANETTLERHNVLSLWSHDKVADFVPIDKTGTDPDIFPNLIRTTNTIDIDFTQDTGFTTEVSYTVKRWSM